MKKLLILSGTVLLFMGAFAQGTWTQLTDYAGASRTSAAVFALDTDGDGMDDMGFIACGFNAGSVDYNDMWAYDPQTDTWTQKASLPGVPRRGVTFFVIDNIAYVGAGAYTTAPGNYLNDFYAYNPITDTWTAIDTLPGDRRWGGYGFSVNGKGYVAMGSSVQLSGTADLDDVYEYDPQTGNWTQKADFPSFPRRGGPSVSIDVNGDGTTDRAYIFDGRTNNTRNGFVNEVWEYIPVSDTWVQRSSKGNQGLATASAAVINNKIYLGMGNTSSGENNMFWSYDVNLDTWTFETLFPGTPSRASHAFTLDNELYISCGANGNNPMNFTYKYTPLDEYSTICGNIYLDVDSNCVNNPGVDQSLEGLFVQANPGPYYGLTDSAGNYCVKVPTGNFTVSELIPATYDGLMTVACPANNEAIVQVDSFGIEIDSVDFANNLPNCPILEVSVTSSVRRYCFSNLYSRIQYCNIGFGDADSVIITYTPSPYITIQSASHPYTTDSTGVMYFDLGALVGDTCGTITIYEQMTCDSDDLGLLSCNGVEISSTTPLCEQPAAWSGGTLAVSVDCSGTDGVEIILTNIGPGNMSDSTDFSVYVDSLLRYAGQVMLDSGESYSFTTAGAGRSIIVMANQEAGYPGGRL